MDGYVNEARIYGTALTASQIALAYTLGSDKPGLAPVLSYNRSGTSLTLFWSPSLTGFILESASSPSAPVWTEVPGVVNNSVTVSTTLGAANFYRLRYP
jgi:hypothetical protein